MLRKDTGILPLNKLGSIKNKGLKVNGLVEGNRWTNRRLKDTTAGV